MAQLEKDGNETEVMVDSGAALHACPSWFSPTTPVNTSVTYAMRTATGEPVSTTGKRRVKMLTDVGISATPYNVSPGLSRALLSVAQLNDAGNTVVFAPEAEGGSYVVKGTWLGRVEECLDNVYVRFVDGALCKVTETCLDELEPVQDHSSLLMEDAHPYPGQTVSGALHSHRNKQLSPFARLW